MALFVVLTVAKADNSTGTIQLAVPTSGAGAITFEQIVIPVVVGGISAVSKVIVPATGLNQKSREYYSAQTVAALAALMV